MPGPKAVSTLLATGKTAQEVGLASMDVPVPAQGAAVVKARSVARPTYISSVSLAFMTTASVASLRSAPSMAVPPEILQGELLILQTHCPDKVSQFQDKLKDLRTADTVKN
jgi:hypothetical protein